MAGVDICVSAISRFGSQRHSHIAINKVPNFKLNKRNELIESVVSLCLISTKTFQFRTSFVTVTKKKYHSQKVFIDKFLQLFLIILVFSSTRFFHCCCCCYYFSCNFFFSIQCKFWCGSLNSKAFYLLLKLTLNTNQSLLICCSRRERKREFKAQKSIKSVNIEQKQSIFVLTSQSWHWSASSHSTKRNETHFFSLPRIFFALNIKTWNRFHTISWILTVTSNTHSVF